MAQEKTIVELLNDSISETLIPTEIIMNVVTASPVAEPITHSQATYELLNNVAEADGSIRVIFI